MTTLRQFILAGSALATGNIVRDHVNNQAVGGGGTIIISGIRSMNKMDLQRTANRDSLQKMANRTNSARQANKSLARSINLDLTHEANRACL